MAGFVVGLAVGLVWFSFGLGLVLALVWFVSFRFVSFRFVSVWFDCGFGSIWFHLIRQSVLCVLLINPPDGCLGCRCADWLVGWVIGGLIGGLVGWCRLALLVCAQPLPKQ